MPEVGQPTAAPGQQGDPWEAQLRAAGCRVTRARRLVLAALATLSHATGEELLAHIGGQAPDLSLSTVYRTLDVLGEVGLVTHAHFQHGVVTYHAVGGPAHIHLVCRECGQVSSLPAAAAAELAAEVARTGFAADISHLTLHGRCATCQAGSTQPATALDPT